MLIKVTGWKTKPEENVPDCEKMLFRRPEGEAAETFTWVWEDGRRVILADFGIYLPVDCEF